MPSKLPDKAKIMIDSGAKNAGSTGRLLFDHGWLFDSGLLFDAPGDTSFIGEKAKILLENKRSRASLIQN